jgi:hypothetical protein
VFGQPEPCVVIAGNGVAASAVACRLLGAGFGAVLLAGRHRGATALAASPVVEALSEATARLFGEVGLAGALEAAGAVVVEGFENRYGSSPGESRWLEAMWIHVDRHRLARSCLTLARRRGATLVPAAARAAPQDPHELGAFAVVDATGRAARWSRPVSRSGSGVATLYAGRSGRNGVGGPRRSSARSGCIVRTPEGWAYRLDHPDGTTVGAVAGSASGRALTAKVAASLELDDADAFVRVGSQPAFVQWSDECAGPGNFLTVGDAALAYSPVAGQGVRFAISSALAATAVITSWRDGGGPSEAIGTDYYRSFVGGARDRHLAKLAALDEDVRPEPVDLDRRLRFIASVRPMEMNMGGRIVRDEGCVLADGGLVRWVGGFDLLHMRDAMGERSTGSGVSAALVAAGMPEQKAQGLLAWGLRVGLLGYEP